jgi:hypothetical protein
MVGVSGPMLAGSAAAGTRFLLGLTAGSLGGSAVLASAGVVAGLSLAHVGLTFGFRRGALVALAAALGIADMANRTPQIWRQVPQRLVRELPPGVLGAVWGFDLGLVVTTKKVTSLWWLAIIGLILVKPWLLVVAVPAGAFVTALSISSWSLQVKDNTLCLRKRQRAWITQLRMTSGVLILATAILFYATTIR